MDEVTSTLLEAGQRVQQGPRRGTVMHWQLVTPVRPVHPVEGWAIVRWDFDKTFSAEPVTELTVDDTVDGA